MSGIYFGTVPKSLELVPDAQTQANADGIAHEFRGVPEESAAPLMEFQQYEFDRRKARRCVALCETVHDKRIA